MSPVWLCPLRPAATGLAAVSAGPDQVYVNFGFWGKVSLPAGATDGYFNRQVEEKVTELDGHKWLYSTSFYSRDEFWGSTTARATRS